MIKSKKLLAIICVFAMIATVFGSLATAAVPAAQIAVTYNEEESDLSSKLVFDITTTADYIQAASIIIPIDDIMDYVEGETAAKKRTAIKNASVKGDPMSAGGTFNVLAISSGFKISYNAPSGYEPADFTSDKLIAQMVIPLSKALDKAVTFSIKNTDDVFLKVGVASDETDTGYEYEDQYAGEAGTLTLTPATVGSSATAEPTATPTAEPTATPTAEPTATPTAEPTATPTAEPTATPTAEPTATPTAEPTATPTAEPTATPTAEPADKVTVDENATAVAADTAYWGVKILEAAEANITAKFETDTESKEVTLVNAAGLDGNGDLAFNLYLKLTGERVGKAVTATVTVGEDSDSGVWAAAN